MELQLYNFSKRVNSTKLPTGDPITLNVVLKEEGVSKDSPVLEIQNPISRLYDYAYFDSTYYWIKDFRFLNEYRHEIVLQEDVLATYKNTIINTPNFCERTSVAFNGYIDETLQPGDMRGYQITYDADFLQAVKPSQGWCAINVSGKSGSRWMELPYDDIDTLSSILYSQTQSELWDKIKGSFEGELTNTIDLANYLNDLVILPFPLSTRGGSREIFLGYFGTGISGAYLDEIVHQGAGSIDVPHPLTSELTTSRAYLRGGRFSNYSLYVPCCGNYKLDAGLLSQVDYVNYRYSVDASGNIYMIVDIQGQPICYITGNCAYRLPVNQRVQQSLSTTASQIITHPIASLFGFNDVMESIIPQASRVQGGGGNAASWMDMKMHLSCTWKEPAAGLDHARLGYPYYGTITPSANGYYKFRDAHVIAGEAWENQEIERFLNSGIFIE